MCQTCFVEEAKILPAFGINNSFGRERFQPGEIFIVMGNDAFETIRFAVSSLNLTIQLRMLAEYVEGMHLTIFVS